MKTINKNVEDKINAIAITSMLLMAFILTIALNAPIAKAQTEYIPITLPEGTPIPWQMEYDGARYIWYSGFTRDPLKGYIVRIDTDTFVTDPSGSLDWWNVIPDTNPEGGAYAVDVGVAIGGGYIWSGGSYSGGDMASDYLVRFHPDTHATMNYTLIGVRNLRTIRFNGENVWLAGSKIIDGEFNGVIMKFDITSESCTNYSLGTIFPYDIIIDDGFIWFSYNGLTVSGIGRMNITDETITYYTTSSNIVFLAKATDGKIWYSSNVANNIGSLDPTTGIITEYPIGIPPENPDNGDLPYDSPYGLRFDALGKLWIAGFDYKKMIEFDPSAPQGEQVIDTIDTDNMPYYSILAGNTIWCWGQGSVAMNIIEPVPPDNTPPSISISSPSLDDYILNAIVLADWSATDDLSGIASTTGTVPSGSPIDTNSVGTKSFTVTATDNAGNTATTSISYYVRYSYAAGRTIFPPLEQVSSPSGLTKSYKLGRTIPIKFQLFDANGVPVGTATATLALNKVYDDIDLSDTVIILGTGESDNDNVFRYDTSGQQYIYNLSTKNLEQGTYKITVSLDDSTSIITYFQLGK